ncbi:MAG: hypothetical protein PHT53_06195 [Candidatus Omnitrophica bacterium]|nr:hypothetical protein [Candidatus Omnitrophota bacterium]
MKKKNLKKAQSIIEYICVTAVFAGVSMAGFVVFIQKAGTDYRGQIPSYRQTKTLDGKTLNDGVPNDQYKWPSDWDDPQPTFNGKIPKDFVNNPDAPNLPAPVPEEPLPTPDDPYPGPDPEGE